MLPSVSSEARPMHRSTCRLFWSSFRIGPHEDWTMGRKPAQEQRTYPKLYAKSVSFIYPVPRDVGWNGNGYLGVAVGGDEFRWLVTQLQDAVIKSYPTETCSFWWTKHNNQLKFYRLPDWLVLEGIEWPQMVLDGVTNCVDVLTRFYRQILYFQRSTDM